MDVGTRLAISGSKDIILKLLGPTADYLGGELQAFTEKRIQNIKKIFENAWEKVKKQGKPQINGTVSPKVLRGTINDGSYADDFLSIDYFGGVLASSRTDVPHDDRGAYFNSLISRLSTYQLRMHYVFYHALKQEFNGSDINFGTYIEKLKLFITFSSFIKAMEFKNIKLLNRLQLGMYFDHIKNGLVKEGLIDKWIASGDKDYIKNYFKDATEDGFIFQAAPLGFELFYWVYGLGGESTRTFFKKDKYFELDQRVIIDGNYKRVNDT